MAKKEKNTPKKTVKAVNVEEKKIEEIVELPKTPVETVVEEEVKEEVEEVLDAKETNEDIDIEEIDTDVKEEDTTENVEVEQVEEEVLPAVEEKKEEKPNKKSCDCKRQLTTKDVFGYMWMGQIYGE